MGNSHARFKVDIKDTNLKDGCSPPTDTLSGLSLIGVCCVGKLQTELWSRNSRIPHGKFVSIVCETGHWVQLKYSTQHPANLKQQGDTGCYVRFPLEELGLILSSSLQPDLMHTFISARFDSEAGPQELNCRMSWVHTMLISAQDPSTFHPIVLLLELTVPRLIKWLRTSAFGCQVEGEGTGKAAEAKTWWSGCG